ncbi:MAG: efflux RND transporter periplasmic adaptor subunit [Gammaproteobacteria bacterium]
MKFIQMQKAMSNIQPPPPAVVAVTEVRQDEWLTTLPAVGNIVAVFGVDVTNEIAGLVKNIHFDSGQHVEKGQLLLELDTETDLSELDGLIAKRRLAEIEFERSNKLITGKFISVSDFDRNRALLDEADASVRTKRSVIAKKGIRAPFSGHLGIRRVDVGQYLMPGSAIVTLQRLAPIHVDFTVPERHLEALSAGQAIKVTVQAYHEKVFLGRVTAISPLLDRHTRSVKIRATLENSERQLRPGMFANVELLSEKPKPVLTLPDTAISYNPYGDFVFVVEKTDQRLTVQSRQVETGVTRNGRVEIVKGLSRGERVVSAGQIKLRNGVQITIEDRPAPGERTEESAS